LKTQDIVNLVIDLMSEICHVSAIAEPGLTLRRDTFVLDPFVRDVNESRCCPRRAGPDSKPWFAGDAVTAILVMDDVAARADAAAAETGTAAPKIPRAPSRFTASVYNDEAAPPPLDSLGDLVKQIAKLSKE
jgi:hypothetical protein